MSKSHHHQETPHGGSVRRLVRCCRCLGIRLGYRYWRLDNKARRDPGLVPVICAAIEAGADRLRAEGNEIEASLMEEWAAEARKANRQFHAENVPDQIPAAQDVADTTTTSEPLPAALCSPLELPSTSKLP